MADELAKIRGLIERLDLWLREYRPSYYQYLQPGLGEEELQHFELELKQQLPDPLKQL